MKKVIAIIGCPRIGGTVKALQLFEEKLKSHDVIDFEYVYLKDINVNRCKGCLNCFIKGEQFCPLKDDTKEIYGKMLEADGVILVTPVYSIQVSGHMKDFLDRLAYVFHRPCFFDKAFMALAVHGFAGSDDVLKYLNRVAHFWGFATSPGLGLNTSQGFVPPRLRVEIEAKTTKAADQFYRMITGKKLKTPGWTDLVMFRLSRSIKPYSREFPRDFEYFLEKGWMDSDYYYPVKLGLFKKLVGLFFDLQGKKYGEKMVKERLAEESAK